jgi:8-oxo-dGTP diphosphatase
MPLETKEATLIYLRKDGMVLLLHRNKRQDDFLFGKYTPPGGKLEEGETHERCAHRELLEEPGLTAELRYRGKVLFDNHKRTFNGKPAKHNYLVHIYESDNFKGELRKEIPEGTLEWIAESGIDKIPMEEWDKTIFNMLEDDGQISLRVIYDGAFFERSEPLNP